MRELDDKIVYALNVSIPTESFKHKSDNSASCSDLLKKIESNYDKRNTAIKECIAITADRVKTLKDERDANKNNTGNDSQFKTEQRKVDACLYKNVLKRWMLLFFLFFFFAVTGASVGVKCWGYNSRTNSKTA